MCEIDKKRGFPSPCGEKVGINEFLLGFDSLLADKFPSPCGEKVGINQLARRVKGSNRWEVSVPLRGKGRDQPGMDLKYEFELDPSFRPLAGKR